VETLRSAIEYIKALDDIARKQNEDINPPAEIEKISWRTSANLLYQQCRYSDEFLTFSPECNITKDFQHDIQLNDTLFDSDKGFDTFELSAISCESWQNCGK